MRNSNCYTTKTRVLDRPRTTECVSAQFYRSQFTHCPDDTYLRSSTTGPGESRFPGPALVQIEEKSKHMTHEEVG